MKPLYLTVPIYWTNVKKTKPNTTHLLGMNWYRNAHFFAQNTAKKEMYDCIEKQLGDYPTIPGQYKVSYTYYYKNKSSDLMNVVSLVSKFANDALQELAVVINDNVQYCLSETAYVGVQDKENPRCVIKVESI